MPELAEPPAPEGKTSVGSALNAFLKSNPQIEKGLAEPIREEEAKQTIVEKPPEGERPPESKKDATPPTEKQPERSKVFGTEIKPASKATPSVDEEAKDMTPKAQAKWQQIKEERDTARMEAEKLRRDYEELGKKTNQDSELPKQLESLKAELAAEKSAREEIEQRLSVEAVAESKEYKAKVSQPRSEIEQAADAIAKKHDLPLKKVMAALEEPIDTRLDALEEIGAELPANAMQVLNLLGMEMDKVQRTAAELRERARTSREHMLSDRQSESQQEQQESRTKAQQIAAKAFGESAKTHAFLSGKTGDEAWDKWVESQRNEVLAVDPADPVKFGTLMADAARARPLEKALDHYKGLYEQTQKDVEALESRLAKYEKANPGIGGRGDGGPTPAEDDSITPGQKIMRGVLAGRR